MSLILLELHAHPQENQYVLHMRRPRQCRTTTRHEDYVEGIKCLQRMRIDKRALYFKEVVSDTIIGDFKYRVYF